MKHDCLPEKTLRLWQLRVSLLAAIPVFACLFFAFWLPWLVLPALFFAVFFLLIIFWYLPRYFKSYDIRFPDGAIVIRRGVFIRTTHIMPFSKLVYVQSISTPLSKYMGLAAISLKAARSSVIIPELTTADVELFLSSVTKEVPS